jgi:protein O-mannosyl-transferase
VKKHIPETADTKIMQALPQNRPVSRFFRTFIVWECFGIIVLFYSLAVNNEFIYDDETLIVNAARPQSIGMAFSVFKERHWPDLPYYRPVARFTMVVQKFIFNDNPAPFHVFNAIIIGIIFLFVFALFRQPMFNAPFFLALNAALLYALHPLASSCVYPICSGRETLLPVMFIIASAFFFLRNGRVSYALALCMFTAALFSKELSIVAIGILFLFDYIYTAGKDNHSRRPAQWVFRYAPFIIVIACYVFIRHLIFGGSAHYHPSVFNHPSAPFWSVLYVLQTVMLPFVQLVYEPWLGIWLSPWRILAVGSILVFIGWRIGKDWKEIHRHFFAWTGWFLISILPTANIIELESHFDERHCLLPALGLFGLAVSLLSIHWKKPPVKRIATVLSTGLIVAAAAVGISRSAYFKNDLSFFCQWYKTNPNNGPAVMGVGTALCSRGNWTQAIPYLQKAVQLGPNRTDTHNSLGIACLETGDLKNAEIAFATALKIDPRFIMAYNNLGVVYLRTNRINEAVAIYQRALQINPNYEKARKQLEYINGLLVKTSGK